MLDVSLSCVAETPEFSHRETQGEKTSTKTGTRQPRMVLCSQVRGRERWYLDALEDNPRLAAAVELVLRSEEGIDGASANPLTGRVLVKYSPDLISESI